MKIHTIAIDQAIYPNGFRAIAEFIRRYLETYRLKTAQMRYRAIRELQQKCDFARGTFDALPLEEKLKMGVYRY